MFAAEEAASADETDSAADDMSDILGTSLSIGRHAFSQMEVDVDRQRRDRTRNTELSVAAEQHRIQ